VGGSPKTLSKYDIIQVGILVAFCTKAQLAHYFGMTEKTFRAVERRQPEVFTANRKCRARAIADVVSALIEKALVGDIRAIQFFVKKRAGWSGKSATKLSRNEDRAFTVEI